ncbi:ral guanine nucleotide dissociation stimulator-like 1 isoform X2 [Tubulanus polymorphus]|uniref:ral guanine nucleotide dissociation stimulator-like 1 isoform X2 n=1 Tax=Tubulanus polymorphus TaxID=672921 RepID=UPI003DA216CF
MESTSPASPIERRCSKEDLNKFWREEREEDALYSVYLKKVVYNSFPEDIIEDDGSKLAWETLKVRHIKAGSLNKLITHLVQDNGLIDSTHVNVFLATYRSFSSVEHVLDALFRRYRKLSDVEMKNEIREAHRKSYRGVINIWLDSYADDFRDPPHYASLNKLIEFAVNDCKDVDLRHRAEQRLEKFKREENIPMRYSEVKFHFCPSNDAGGHIRTSSNCYEFMTIPYEVMAEQLTYKDAELFRKIVPHHCLGGVWSKRMKHKDADTKTILATIDQFNAVSYRVISTILTVTNSHKASHRAKAITKWIDIARELRELKNFSSLNAIVSGLQSNPIYRLKKTWSLVPKEYQVLFDELSAIFSEDNNQISCRTLLMKEGTAKFANASEGSGTLRLRRKGSQRRKSWYDLGQIQGTVPYLGTFLRDLTYLDTAIPDYTENGLINFDKKKKEFEIIAMIKLLKSAAGTYSIQPDPRFHEWFDSIAVFNEKESHELSCQLESLSLKKKPSWVLLILRCCCFLSLSRRSSAENLSVPSSPYGSDDRMSLSSTNSSSPSPKVKRPIQHSVSMNSLESQDPKATDTCIIKVRLEGFSTPCTSLYKGILLTNCDHTSSVIKRVFEKYDLHDQVCADDYCIAQILPDRELAIPPCSNVFYAMNNTADLTFVVRKKSAENETTPSKTKKGKNKLTPRKSLT